ncbi:hypothetical protein UlMin_004905 [Ulmus minor]
MAIFSTSSSENNRGCDATNLNLKVEVVKEIRSYEVALAELNSLSSHRSVYQKNGNKFFRTTILKATTYEQKQLDQAKFRLDKLNSS